VPTRTLHLDTDAVFENTAPTSVTVAEHMTYDVSPAVLVAFAGVGTVAFRVASTIGEHFTSGGGNVAGSIHTFVAAAVTVCYRYAPPPGPTTTSAPTTSSTTSASPPVPVARFTG
jgi:hypothetical protein